MLATTFTLADARDLAYLIAIAGFILALKGLSSPRHARLGEPGRRRGGHPGHRHDLHASRAAPLGQEPRARDRRHGPRRCHRGAGGAVREDDRDAPTRRHLQRRRRRRGGTDLHRRAAPPALPGPAARRLRDGRGPVGRAHRVGLVLGKRRCLRQAAGAHHGPTHHLPGPAGDQRSSSASSSSS